MHACSCTAHRQLTHACAWQRRGLLRRGTRIWYRNQSAKVHSGILWRSANCNSRVCNQSAAGCRLLSVLCCMWSCCCWWSQIGAAVGLPFPQWYEAGKVADIGNWSFGEGGALQHLLAAAASAHHIMPFASCAAHSHSSVVDLAQHALAAVAAAASARRAVRGSAAVPVLVASSAPGCKDGQRVVSCGSAAQPYHAPSRQPYRPKCSRLSS